MAVTAGIRLLQRSRPRFWFYLAGPVLVGIAYGASSATELVSIHAIALFGYFLLPANLFLYGINDVFDARIDRENPKKDARELRYRGGDFTLPATVLSAGLGLAFAFVLPLEAFGYVVLFLVLGGAYSAPPFRLKVRPPFDSLSNGLYILPGAAAYVALSGSQPPILALAGGWLWTMAMHSFSAIPDIGPDRRGGIRTTATVLGRTGTLIYCLATWGTAAAVFGVLSTPAGLLLAVYPAMTGVFLVARLDIERAYWWFPALNTLVGALLTMGGLVELLGVVGR